MKMNVAFKTAGVPFTAARPRSAILCTSIQHPPSRRLLLSAAGITAGVVAASVGVAAAAAAAVVMTASNPNPRAMISQGMRKFEAADVEGSLQDFDAALAADPRVSPLLWQRGLSLYYVDRLEDAARQFRDDVAANPNDAEEAIWAFVCEARLKSPQDAREQFLVTGRDSRPVMRAALEAFRTGSSPDAILAAAGGDTSGHAAFYANLYVALYAEAHGDEAKAKNAMLSATETQYAQLSGDYMAALARVHCVRRGWAA